MNGACRLLTFLTAQRAAELVYANRNTKALLARGAYESGAGQYPLIVALHAAWLASLWQRGRGRRVDLRLLAALGVLQLARVWVLRTLGARWTTRIIILPGAPRVKRGPYRLMRHPNYAVVALEIPCVPLALGLYRHAAIFGAANVAMLAWRIGAEDRAYRAADSPAAGADDAAERARRS